MRQENDWHDAWKLAMIILIANCGLFIAVFMGLIATMIFEPLIGDRAQLAIFAIVAVITECAIIRAIAR
jgi:membrane protein implicated in regulation of membrane protease activity